MSKPKNVAGEFRASLVKIMPGYDWTVHRSNSDTFIEATGTKSSGFNRLSTLNVTRVDKGGHISYTAKSAGVGKRAPWLGSFSDQTLARALRGLEETYLRKARTFYSHAAHLDTGRKVDA